MPGVIQTPCEVLSLFFLVVSGRRRIECIAAELTAMRERRVKAADSTGQCNTFAEHLSGRVQPGVVRAAAMDIEAALLKPKLVGPNRAFGYRGVHIRSSRSASSLLLRR